MVVVAFLLLLISILFVLVVAIVTIVVVVVVVVAVVVVVVSLVFGRVCSSEVQKNGGGKEEGRKQQSLQFRKTGGGGPICKPSKMTLFSSLLHPKAISRGFSILCVGEEAFSHLFVLQRRLSFALLCFLAFLLPSEYVWLSPSCLSVKTFHP